MIRDQIDSIAAVADSVAEDLRVQHFGLSYLTTGFFLHKGYKIELVQELKVTNFNLHFNFRQGNISHDQWRFATLAPSSVQIRQ